jgi:hypothetical protein
MSPQSSITHHRITGKLVDGGIRRQGCAKVSASASPSSGEAWPRGKGISRQ